MAVTNNTAPSSNREKREEEPVLREGVLGMGSSFFVFTNPDNPYGEYILIFPKDYREGFTFHDYAKIFKPIKAQGFETTLTAP